MYRIKFLIYIILVGCTTFSFSQKNLQFSGMVSYKNNFIPYQIYITESQGKVIGYSVSNPNGADETKTLLSGTYNVRDHTLSFQEESIVYTKSKTDVNDFCYVHFTGTMKRNAIQGDFKGLYPDGTPCVAGKIQLMDQEMLIKKTKKIAARIQKSKKIADSIKEKITGKITFVEQKKLTLGSGEVARLFWGETDATIYVYETARVDGDVITITHNDQTILDRYEISKDRKKVPIKLVEGDNHIHFRSISEGSVPYTTLSILLESKNHHTEIKLSLKKGERSSIKIVNNL